MTRGLVPSLLCLLAPWSAFAAGLKPASVTASSSYPPEDGTSYDASQVIDGKASTSWVEGDPGNGLGAWVEFDLGGAKTITRLRVWGAIWYSTDFWERAGRPKELELKFADGSTVKMPMSDEMKPQDFTLPKPTSTTSLRVRISAAYNGTTWSDTAISEIQVFDAATTGPSVAAVTASSEAPADADGYYYASNVVDGLPDTMWCEGNKASDGTGEHLEIRFSGSQAISKVTVVNGIGGSLAAWMKGNRTTAALLTFSDGGSERVTIKNSMLPQVISFPSHTTSSVKVTFETIVKGKEYDDLCISEAYFE